MVRAFQVLHWSFDVNVTMGLSTQLSIRQINFFPKI